MNKLSMTLIFQVLTFQVVTFCHGVSVAIDINTMDFASYFNADTKELNLGNIPLGNENLATIQPKLKNFIKHVEVERLILENTNLTNVPYELVGFALTCKSLKYVSFLGNKFNIDSQSATVVADDSVLDSRPRSSSFLEPIVSQVWGNISPEIEKAITEHNSNGSKFKYFNKIIVIDKGLPPITILDSYRRPYSYGERAKYVLVRLGFIGLGIIITSVPSVLAWTLEKYT